MIEPSNTPLTSARKGLQYLKIALGVLLLLSNITRHLGPAADHAAPALRPPAAALGYLIGTLLLGIVLPIWLINSAVKRLRSGS